MIFKTMPLEERKKLIQGLPDLLTEEQKKEQAYFNSFKCLRCGEDVYPYLNSKLPFKKGKMIPNTLAKCISCEAVFEPYTKIEVSPPVDLPQLEI